MLSGTVCRCRKFSQMVVNGDDQPVEKSHCIIVEIMWGHSSAMLIIVVLNFELIYTRPLL
jgi:hypothetical protein